MPFPKKSCADYELCMATAKDLRGEVSLWARGTIES